MTSPTAYEATLRAYVDGARGLFAPLPAARGLAIERGEAASAPGSLVADRAEELAPQSAALTRAAGARLADPDPEVRADTATQLLAKALADLQISARLLEAALDEEAGLPSARGLAVERGISALTGLEESLRFLSGESAAGFAAAERGLAAPPADVPAARAQLTQTAGDTLALIRDRAGKTGQSAVSGLLTLGAGELAQAAGVVGMDVAEALGIGGQVTRLVGLFREFALNAYNALVELLGPGIAKMAAQQVANWINDGLQGEKFGKLLDRLYVTAQTAQQVGQVATASQAELGKFVAAIQGVDALSGQYGQQIGLIEKLLKGLRLFGSVPAAALPYGRVLLAAAYIVLAAYVILAGADLVDAPKLKGLDRVPGVRKIVETNLTVV